MNEPTSREIWEKALLEHKPDTTNAYWWPTDSDGDLERIKVCRLLAAREDHE